MKWIPYKHIFREYGLQDTELTDQLWEDALHEIALKVTQGEADGIHFDTVYAQYRWWKNGKEAIYIDTRSLVDFVANAKFSVDSIDIPMSGNVVFLFPNDATIDGCRIPPILASEGVVLRGSNTINAVSFFLSKGSLEHGKCSVCGVPSDRISEFLSGSGDYGKDVSFGHEYFIIAARLCVYLSVFPQALIHGFPESMKLREDRAHNKSSCQNHTMRLSGRFSNTPLAHFRRGHFRMLRHERFRRNIDGSNRIVYVNNSIVAATGNEKTAIKVDC